MRISYIPLIALLLLAVCMLVGCSEQPEYMHPYGEGVDPDTVVTKPYQTITTTSSSVQSTTATTTDTAQTTLPTTAVLEIPEGYVVCPLCEGVKIVCDICFGTGKCKIEVYDPDTDLYVRKYSNCTNCLEEDPGYMLCEMCHNRLYIEE